MVWLDAEKQGLSNGMPRNFFGPIASLFHSAKVKILTFSGTDTYVAPFFSLQKMVHFVHTKKDTRFDVANKSPDVIFLWKNNAGNVGLPVAI